MRELIRQGLVNKYKSLGYSQKAVNTVLDFLEKSVKEEAEIEEAVSGVGPMLKIFQSEIDARITAAEKARKEKEDEESSATGVETETGKKSTKKDSDDMPAWAKAFTEGLQTQVASLQGELTNIKSSKTTESRKQVLEAKIKDAPEKIKAKILKDFSKFSFEKDEDFESYLEETATDLAEITQSLTDQGLGQSSKPFSPTGSGSSQSQVQSDIEKWSKSTAPLATK